MIYWSTRFHFSMFLSEFLCLPSNIKKVVDWSEKSGLWLWSQFVLAAERPQTDLASASMMLHFNDSVECSMEEIALKGKRVAGGIETNLNPLTKQRLFSAFFPFQICSQELGIFSLAIVETAVSNRIESNFPDILHTCRSWHSNDS